MEKNREAGYYKVRFKDGDWVLGLWFYNYWLLPGSDRKFSDEYFGEINEVIILKAAF